jgi:hypothetical protein
VFSYAPSNSRLFSEPVAEPVVWVLVVRAVVWVLVVLVLVVVV